MVRKEVTGESWVMCNRDPVLRRGRNSKATICSSSFATKNTGEQKRSPFSPYSALTSFPQNER
jgi:hypothetical protein